MATQCSTMEPRGPLIKESFTHQIIDELIHARHLLVDLDGLMGALEGLYGGFMRDNVKYGKIVEIHNYLVEDNLNNNILILNKCFKPSVRRKRQQNN